MIYESSPGTSRGLYWENKTYKLKRSIVFEVFEMGITYVCVFNSF